MGRLKLSILFLALLLISSASATVTTLGTFEINTTIDLPQVANATSCNITSIKYPNSTVILENVEMDKDGTDFNFTLLSDFTHARGVYLVNGECDLTVFVYDFKITRTGTDLTTGEGLLYLVFLFAALIFLSFCIYWIFHLPGGNEVMPAGEIVSINDWKYLKIFLVPVSYVVLMWIFALLYSISSSFLALGGPEAFFFWGYRIMLGFAYPLAIIGLWFFFLVVITDRRILKSLKSGRPFKINEQRR